MLRISALAYCYIDIHMIPPLMLVLSVTCADCILFQDGYNRDISSCIVWWIPYALET